MNTLNVMRCKRGKLAVGHQPQGSSVLDHFISASPSSLPIPPLSPSLPPSLPPSQQLDKSENLGKLSRVLNRDQFAVISATGK